MPVRLKNRGVRGAGCLAALTLLVAGCSLGGESEATSLGRRRADGSRRDRPGRRSAEGRLGGSGRRRLRATPTRRSRRSLKGYQPPLSEDGLAAAAESAGSRRATLQEGLAEAEPAPGDEAQVEEMAALYEQAGALRTQAVGVEVRERRPPLLRADGPVRGGDVRRLTPSRRSSAQRDAPPRPTGPYATARRAGGCALGRPGVAALPGARSSASRASARRTPLGLTRPPAAGYGRCGRSGRRRNTPPGSSASSPSTPRPSPAQKQADAAYSSGDFGAASSCFAKSNRLVSESTDAHVRRGLCDRLPELLLGEARLGARSVRPARCGAAPRRSAGRSSPARRGRPRAPRARLRAAARATRNAG